MRARRRQHGAWLLLVLTLVPLLVAAGWQTARVGDSPRSLDPVTGDVVVVGVPGLTWDLIAERTPHLRDLASAGSGTLVVRGVDRVTCPAQGWMTLGAGQRAGAGLGNNCTAPDVAADGSPVGWQLWRDVAAEQSLSADLGTLAAAVGATGGCVSAYGPLAALAAADGQGQVTSYRPEGLVELARAGSALEDECRLHLVSAPAVLEGDRSDTLAATDQALGLLRAGLPEDTTIVVAGLADTNGRAEMHAVLVDPVPAEGVEGSALLTAPSTRQPGLVQTTDLTATLLALLDVPVPAGVAGDPMTLLADDAAPEHSRDLAQAATWTTTLLPWTGGVLAVLLLPPLLIALVLRRRRATAGRPDGTAYVAAGVGTAAMAVPAASFLAGLLPWWRAGQPFVGLVGATLGGMLLLLAVAWGGPWRRDPRGPVAVLAALTVVVIGVDVVFGGPLGLIAFLGVQPLEAGRFYGMGNVAFGAVSAAALVLAGCLASWLAGRGRQALYAVLVVGLVVTAVDGVPSWGADFGGVPALLVATGVLALPVAGVRLSAVRVGLIGLVAVAVAGALMVLDWLRPAGERSHLGDFVQQVVDGTALQVVTRKLEQSVGILLAYPASWIAVASLVLVVVALARPGSAVGRPLRALWVWPHLRPTAWALLACWVLGWVLNDSGIAVVAMGLTVAVGAGIAVAVRTRTPAVAT